MEGNYFGNIRKVPVIIMIASLKIEGNLKIESVLNHRDHCTRIATEPDTIIVQCIVQHCMGQLISTR